MTNLYFKVNRINPSVTLEVTSDKSPVYSLEYNLQRYLSYLRDKLGRCNKNDAATPRKHQLKINIFAILTIQVSPDCSILSEFYTVDKRTLLMDWLKLNL